MNKQTKWIYLFIIFSLIYMLFPSLQNIIDIVWGVFWFIVVIAGLWAVSINGKSGNDATRK